MANGAEAFASHSSTVTPRPISIEVPQNTEIVMESLPVIVELKPLCPLNENIWEESPECQILITHENAVNSIAAEFGINIDAIEDNETISASSSPLVENSETIAEDSANDSQNSETAAQLQEEISQISRIRDQIVSIGLQYQGIPYLWGGTSPNTGFDCSGFVQFVHRQVGINLPRSTSQQIYAGVSIAREEAQPGDIVFTSSHHVGIYMGNNQILDSPQPGDVIRVRNIWVSNPIFIRVT